MLTLAIQAGGGSRRMGRDKALMPFLGKPLIQRIVERLSPLSDDVFVTTNQPAGYLFLGLRLVPDQQRERGALVGLRTALLAARHPLVAVVACDMPFASRSLFEFMRDRLQQSDLDAVVPASQNGLEPLHAVYRRQSCLPLIERALARGDRKIVSWFDQARVQLLTTQEVAAFDPGGLAFWNMNTPEEFRLAEQQAASEPDV